MEPSGEFVNSIAVLAQRAAAAEGKRPTFEEHFGIPYAVTQAGYTDLRKERAHPPTLVLSTLTGLVDFLGTELNGPMGPAALHVVSPTRVDLIGPVDLAGVDEGDEIITSVLPSRPTIARAACQPSGAAFTFGKFYDPESFVVALLTLFGDAGHRGNVLKLVGNLRDENVKTVADDGVTQVVTARAGVAVVSEVAVPNPVELAPFRTFPDLAPLPTAFLLRVRRGQTGELPTVALFEADGGAWSLATVAAIKAWLSDRVKVPVLA